MDSLFKQDLQNIADRETEIAEQRKELHAQGVATIQDIVNRLHIHMHEIRWPSPLEGIESRVRRPHKTIKPKYRGPDGELWCGRGRKPLWVVRIMENGEDLETYRIR